jgi:hypothetical protein
MKTSFTIPLSVALAIAWLTLGNLRAQPEGVATDQTLAQLADRVDDFLRRVGRNEVKDAVDSLLEESPLRDNFTRVTELRDAIRRELPKYGVFMGAENIRTERVGRSMIECVSIYKGLEYPVVWRFTFYRPDSTGNWVVVAVRFDVNYDRLTANGKPRDVDAGD